MNHVSTSCISGNREGFLSFENVFLGKICCELCQNFYITDKILVISLIETDKILVISLIETLKKYKTWKANVYLILFFDSSN